MAAFQYGGPSPMQLAGYVQGQGQIGKQQGEDSRLARLVSGAMADPSKRQANLAEVASFRPEAAFAAQDQFNSQDDRKYAELGKKAAILAGAPEAMRPQVWAQLRPQLEQEFGMTGLPDMPTPEVVATAQQLAQVYGGMNDSSQLPASVREAQAFRADPSLLETRRQMYGSYSYGEIPLPDGTVAKTRNNSRTGQMEMVLPGGQVVPLAGATPLGGGQPQGAPPVQQPPSAPPQPAPSPGIQPGSADQVIAEIEATEGPLPEPVKAQLRQQLLAGGPVNVANPSGAQPPARPPQYPARANEVGGGPVPPLPGSGRTGFGKTDADRARAEADKAGRVEEAKLRSQLSLGGDVKAGEAEGEGLAKQGLERVEAIRQKAALASTQSASLDELERLLTQAYTGPGASTVLSLGKLGTLIGVGDGEKVSAAEAAQAISNRLALSLRNPAGGEGMPGAMSDADRAFLQSSIPSLQNTPDGWKQMIAFQRKLNEAAIDQAKEVERFLASGGKPRDVYAHMQGYAERNPIFGNQGGSSAQGPKAGQVEDGFRFKGGDPADRNNWEQI